MKHTLSSGLGVLRARVEALGAHPLATLLHDQLRILQRVEEDPPGLFAPDDPLRAYNEELTAWEHEHLRSCLAAWLDVIEANRKWDAASAPTLNVRDFGAQGDGVADDRAALERALHAVGECGGGATLHFPAGRYRLGLPSGERTHLTVRGLHDVVLQGEPGTELIGSQAAGLVRFEECRNVRLRGFAFDYEPLLYSQGTVTEISPDRRSFVCEFEADFPQPNDWKLDAVSQPNRPRRLGDAFYTALFVRENGLFENGQPHIACAERCGSQWRLFLDGDETVSETVQAGQRMLLNKQVNWTHGVTISDCAWMDLEAVEIWGSTQFSLYIESSWGVSVRHSRVRPKPDGRLGGINRDGIHCRSNRFGPFLEACEVIRCADDCLNFQSKMVSIDAVLDERTLVLDLPWHNADRLGYWNPMRRDFAPGDLLAFMNPQSGDMACWAKIESIAEHDWHGHRRLRALLDRPLPALTSRDDLGKREPVQSSSEYLNVAAPVCIEYFAVNAATKNDGFIIRDCVLGDNTVTGGKIKSGNGLILGNRTRNHGWCAWSLATEIIWQEGYGPRRLLVEGNRHDTRFGLYMDAQLPLKRPQTAPSLNYRVEIVGNTFNGQARDGFALNVNAVSGCVIEGNTFGAGRPIQVGPTARGVRIANNRDETHSP